MSIWHVKMVVLVGTNQTVLLNAYALVDTLVPDVNTRPLNLTRVIEGICIS